MNNYNITWKYCLPNWINHTFPNSVKTGTVTVTAKNINEAKAKFREIGYYDCGVNPQGYYRIENISNKAKT